MKYHEETLEFVESLIKTYTKEDINRYYTNALNEFYDMITILCGLYHHMQKDNNFKSKDFIELIDGFFLIVDTINSNYSLKARVGEIIDYYDRSNKIKDISNTVDANILKSYRKVKRIQQGVK